VQVVLVVVQVLVQVPMQVEGSDTAARGGVSGMTGAASGAVVPHRLLQQPQ